MRFSRRLMVYQEPKYLYLCFFLNFLLILVSIILFLPMTLRGNVTTMLLPRAISRPAPNVKDGIITILKDGAIFLGLRPVSLVQLRGLLKMAYIERIGASVLLKVDRGVSIEDLSAVIDSLDGLGLKNIYIASHE